MAIRVEQSEWRSKRWEWHGEKVYECMQQRFSPGTTFNILQVAGLRPLQHLADRTAYDTATAICRELELRRKLKRQGQMMYLVKRRS